MPPLTTEERQHIRDEEFFRAEVAKEISGRKPAPTVAQHIAGFFETKIGFWLLTTVMAGAVGLAFSSVQKQMYKDERTRQEQADSSRRDTETLLKLVPMLLSEKPAETGMATVLLNNLAAKEGVSKAVANDIQVILTDATKNGLGPNASKEARRTASEVVTKLDAAGAQAMRQVEPETSQSPAEPTQAPLTVALPDLPIRVYIQISDASQRKLATDVVKRLEDASILAPGIELVSRGSPSKSNLRYCGEKVSTDALKRVTNALEGLMNPPPAPLILNKQLCNRVRNNHFELWFAKV